MKQMGLAALLAACLALLGGCGVVEGALQDVGRRFESTVDTPQNNGGDIDWSFVPVVREMAEDTFSEAFPEAEITQTNVASVNGRDARVVVVLTYTLDGKSGEYGFDYEKNAQGAYDLKRYGEGVGVEDLH